MALSVVVLPPPLEPSSATTLPSGTSSETSDDADQVAVAHLEMLDLEQRPVMSRPPIIRRLPAALAARAEIGLDHGRVAR